MAAPAKTAKPTRSKLDPVHIDVGLHTLYPNPDDSSSKSHKHNLDIIAIPGLGANPEWTWIWKNKTNNTNVHWLRDSNMLARKVPNARISIFGYQSQWFGKGSIDQRIENVADQLLYQLERMRGENNKTPIIFISHCLGGIVLEKAILTARLRQNDFPSIFPFVAGCVFLGTPFHGTNTQAKAMVLAEMAETIGLGVPSSLLKLLEKDSEVLLRMLDDFVRLATDAHIRLFCFFESEKSDLAGLFKLPFKKQELIVDRESATFPGVESLQLSSDHFGLNKYSGPKDSNFVFVSNEIKVTAQRAAGIIKARTNAHRQALISDRTYHALIDTLGKGFSDLDATIKGNYKGPKGDKPTWVSEVDSYKQWKEKEGSQLLWIHGKAGTGQGLIASSVAETLIRTKEDESIISSFFCDQSDEHRRSLRGMLKILIRQIIDRNQDLAVHLLTDARKGKGSGKQDFDPEALNKIPVLWDALRAMASSLPNGTVYVILYGIDQLSEDSLEQFQQYLKDATNKGTGGDEDSEASPIKWMLLSRSGRPDIEKAVKATSAYEIDIDDSENSELVSDALRADISARVDDLELSAPLTYFIKRQIYSRAEDNYIYISLVIQEVKNAQASGLIKYAEFRALLESFPYGLTNMFEHIRKRVLGANSEDIEHTKEILRCMILAQRAPTMRELAVIADLPHHEWEDVEKLKAHIIRCGAFLTLRGNELDEDNMTVEWIDISAREHLEKFAKTELALGLKDMQHGIIALRSLEYIYSITERYEAAEATKREQEDEDRDSDAGEEAKPDGGSDGSGEDDDDDEPQIELAPPTIAGSDTNEEDFDPNEALQYPVQYWIEHSKHAPVDILQEFRTGHSFWKEESPPRQDWWSVNDTMHILPNQTNVTPLHVATIADFPPFVEHLLEHGWTDNVHTEDSLGFQPLFYACAVGNFEIVQILLGANADIDYVSSEDNVTAFYAAAETGHVDIVECLLERGADINAKSDTHGSPLYVACEQNHTAIAKLLIERKADVNLVGGAGRRALNIAAWNGNLEVIRLLIEHGAEIDPEEEYWYGSAVGTASRKGHAEVVKFLLSKGWSPNKPMKTYGSFLTAAATYGHLHVVDILVQKEARITVLEQALAAASQNGKEAVVKAILDKTPTLRHQKAFMLAADYGRDEVLKLLFPRGMSQEKLDEALFVSADHEHEETVKLLLEFGADPNAEGPIYGCALTASAYDGTEAIMQALIDKGADVNKRGGDYGTPLQAAAWFGDADNVKMLIDHGALVNTEPIGIYGHPLQAAAESGDIDSIRLLLENHADVNANGGKYGYAIIAAVDQGDSDAIKILIEHNCDVDVHGGEDNWPVISLAGSTVTKEDLELILDHGADINAVCDQGTTALINCADVGDAEGLEFLLSKGANVHFSSHKWGTALHVAAAGGDIECCKTLLNAGADVNAVGGPTGTPLEAAAGVPDLDLVKLMLEAGADATGLETIAGDYGTPLQAACYAGDIAVVRELIEHGAVIDLQHAHGEHGFALHAAAVAGNTDIVEELLSHDASVNLEGGVNGFALIAAASKPANDDIIQLLLDHGAVVAAQGGQFGSTVAAAAFANNASALELLIDRGANVHSVGGKYGSALICAAVKANDMSCIDILLSHAVDVNFRGGKYHTALIAAAYFDRQDLVSKLLDSGADFRHYGGKFSSAISAAGIRNNKTILEKLLKMGPPEQLLDQALVEACAHRQATSVEILLKSGANVYARHPRLGTAIDALKGEQADGYNSDDEHEDPADYDSDDEDDDEDDEDEDEDEDEEWEGDGESVAGASDEEGSITDLQLEDEVSEEAKIQKLLDDAMARVKRNPSVKRFRTVKRGALPPSLKAGPPPQLTPRTSYQQFNSSAGGPNMQQHSQQPYPLPSRQSFQAYPGPNQPGSGYLPQNHQPPPVPGYAPYRGSVSGPPQQQIQQQAASPSISPSRKPVPNSFQQPPPNQYSNPPPQRQQSNGPQNENPPPLPPRSGSQEHAPQRHSMLPPGRGPQLNPGSSGRYRQQQPQQQQRQPSYPSPPAGYGQPPPAQHQYSSPPQSSYNSPPAYNSPPPPQQYRSPPQPQYQSPPPSQYQPLTSQPPGQETGYIAYGNQSQSSSQTSFQSSQYANSTQYGGNQPGPYGTPNSSQTSFHQQGQGQPRRWNTGGYDGEGYG